MVTTSQIEEMVRIIVKDCEPDKIILFGSYARGAATEDSDVDLAIVKTSDLPRFKRTREIRSALRANGKRWYFSMDILVFTPEEVATYKDAPYSLINEILLTGKVLYESKRSTVMGTKGQPGLGGSAAAAA